MAEITVHTIVYPERLIKELIDGGVDFRLTTFVADPGDEKEKESPGVILKGPEIEMWLSAAHARTLLAELSQAVSQLSI